MSEFSFPSFPTHGPDVPKLESWHPIENIVSGNPTHKIYIVSDAPGGKFECGMYECTPGKFVVDSYYVDAYEFSHLLEGRVTASDTEGNSRTYGPGDTFITPQGFKGFWEVHETVRKVFCIRYA